MTYTSFNTFSTSAYLIFACLLIALDIGNGSSKILFFLLVLFAFSMLKDGTKRLQFCFTIFNEVNLVSGAICSTIGPTGSF